MAYRIGSVAAAMFVAWGGIACGGAQGGETAGAVARQDDGPPSGIGRRDDAATLGPFEEGQALAILGHKSSEANGTVNSWLLLGEHDAGLIDAQLVLSEGRAVAEMIRESGRTLRWIWVTHGHPDHSTGLAPIVEAFPDAVVLAHPRVAEQATTLFERYRAPLNRFFPGDIPDAPVVPTAHDADTLELEGVTIQILTFEDGEAEFTTALHIPSQRALFCADMVYHRVFPWLNEMRLEGVRGQVDALENMADVEVIYPGHGEPIGKDYLDTYRAYLDFFEREVPAATDANDLVARVWRAHRDWRSLAGLRFSATAYVDAREEPVAETAADPSDE